MRLGEGERPRISTGTIATAIAASVVVHLGLLAALGRERSPPPPPNVPVEFEVVEREPPPPEPVPEPEPEPEPAPAPKPKVVRVEKPPPPPPPNTPPPAEAPAKPPPVKIGVSLGSTSQGGSFAVGVGNTLYGKADDEAADPSEVRPYVAPAGPRYVPSTRLTSLPKKLSEPHVDYPEEAKRAGVEGEVKLLLRIDETGQVVGVKILKGPGYGLEGAAEKAAWSWRFRPGLADGAPVVTEIPLTYTFYLE